MKPLAPLPGIKARILRLLLCLAILNLTFLYHKAQGQSIFNKNMTFSQASMLVTSNSGSCVMSTVDIECRGSFAFDSVAVLKSANSLNFSLDAASLTSMNSQLDELVHATIKTTEYNRISYTIDSAIIVPGSFNIYVIRTRGMLKVAGKQQEAKMELTARISPDKTVNLTGMLKFKLSDYDLVRPAGSLKVKDNVALVLNLSYQNQESPLVLTKN